MIIPRKKVKTTIITLYRLLYVTSTLQTDIKTLLIVFMRIERAKSIYFKAFIAFKRFNPTLRLFTPYDLNDFFNFDFTTSTTLLKSFNKLKPASPSTRQAGFLLRTLIRDKASIVSVSYPKSLVRPPYF